MSDRAGTMHIGGLFQEFGLVEEGGVDRRVMAARAFLEAAGSKRRTN